MSRLGRRGRPRLGPRTTGEALPRLRQRGRPRLGSRTTGISQSTVDADILDSEDDDVEFGTNENYAAADKEWKHFETHKIKRHRPFVEAKKQER